MRKILSMLVLIPALAHAIPDDGSGRYTEVHTNTRGTKFFLNMEGIFNQGSAGKIRSGLVGVEYVNPIKRDEVPEGPIKNEMMSILVDCSQKLVKIRHYEGFAEDGTSLAKIPMDNTKWSKADSESVLQPFIRPICAAKYKD